MSSLQVAVFDTAFHQTMPSHAYMYALPYELYEKHAVRKYGFHGTSYLYLLRQASQLLNKPEGELNLIACHIGTNHTFLYAITYTLFLPMHNIKHSACQWESVLLLWSTILSCSAIAPATGWVASDTLVPATVATALNIQHSIGV